MPDFLVFRLAAAMAATGDIAAQPRRDSERWPARSAVLGLVGAALGLERSNREAQARLQEGYDVAIHVKDAGTSLRDYHTVQTIPNAAVKRPDSRPKALKAGRHRDALNTILTNREYREGMYVEIALLPRKEATWTIEDIVDALARPAFVLYFGRKACPLTSPLHPVKVSAKNVFDALESYGALEALRASPEHVEDVGDIFLDGDLLDNRRERARAVRRWDIAVDRERWHFAERDAYVVSPIGGEARS